MKLHEGEMMAVRGRENRGCGGVNTRVDFHLPVSLTFREWSRRRRRSLGGSGGFWMTSAASDALLAAKVGEALKKRKERRLWSEFLLNEDLLDEHAAALQEEDGVKADGVKAWLGPRLNELLVTFLEHLKGYIDAIAARAKPPSSEQKDDIILERLREKLIALSARTIYHIVDKEAILSLSTIQDIVPPGLEETAMSAVLCHRKKEGNAIDGEIRAADFALEHLHVKCALKVYLCQALPPQKGLQTRLPRPPLISMRALKKTLEDWNHIEVSSRCDAYKAGLDLAQLYLAMHEPSNAIAVINLLKDYWLAKGNEENVSSNFLHDRADKLHQAATELHWRLDDERVVTSEDYSNQCISISLMEHAILDQKYESILFHLRKDNFEQIFSMSYRSLLEDDDRIPQRSGINDEQNVRDAVRCSNIVRACIGGDIDPANGGLQICVLLREVSAGKEYVREELNRCLDSNSIHGGISTECSGCIEGVESLLKDLRREVSRIEQADQNYDIGLGCSLPPPLPPPDYTQDIEVKKQKINTHDYLDILCDCQTLPETVPDFNGNVMERLLEAKLDECLDVSRLLPSNSSSSSKEKERRLKRIEIVGSCSALKLERCLVSLSQVGPSMREPALKRKRGEEISKSIALMDNFGELRHSEVIRLGAFCLDNNYAQASDALGTCDLWDDLMKHIKNSNGPNPQWKVTHKCTVDIVNMMSGVMLYAASDTRKLFIESRKQNGMKSRDLETLLAMLFGSDSSVPRIVIPIVQHMRSYNSLKALAVLFMLGLRRVLSVKGIKNDFKVREIKGFASRELYDSFGWSVWPPMKEKMGDSILVQLCDCMEVVLDRLDNAASREGIFLEQNHSCMVHLLRGDVSVLRECYDEATVHYVNSVAIKCRFGADLSSGLALSPAFLGERALEIVAKNLYSRRKILAAVAVSQCTDRPASREVFQYLKDVREAPRSKRDSTRYLPCIWDMTILERLMTIYGSTSTGKKKKLNMVINQLRSPSLNVHNEPKQRTAALLKLKRMIQWYIIQDLGLAH